MHQEEPKPITLVPGRSDIELAREYRERVLKALEPVILLLNEARRAGFHIQFQYGANGFGQVQLTGFDIVKLLKLD